MFVTLCSLTIHTYAVAYPSFIIVLIVITIIYILYVSVWSRELYYFNSGEFGYFKNCVFVQGAEEDEEPEGRASSEEESSDDDKSWVDEVREQRRLLWQEGRDRRRQERKETDRNTVLLDREPNETEKNPNMSTGKESSQPQFYQIKAGEEFRSFNDVARKQKLQKYVHECM